MENQLAVDMIDLQNKTSERIMTLVNEKSLDYVSTLEKIGKVLFVEPTAGNYVCVVFTERPNRVLILKSRSFIDPNMCVLNLINRCCRGFSKFDSQKDDQHFTSLHIRAMKTKVSVLIEEARAEVKKMMETATIYRMQGIWNKKRVLVKLDAGGYRIICDKILEHYLIVLFLNSREFKLERKTLWSFNVQTSLRSTHAHVSFGGIADSSVSIRLYDES